MIKKRRNGEGEAEAGAENSPPAAALTQDEAGSENGSVVPILKAVRRHGNNSRGKIDGFLD
jgi:hypothetical protein